MTRTYLYQYSDVSKEIEHIKEEIIRLEARMLSPRTSVLSDIPKGPPSQDDQMAMNLIKLEKLREKYQFTLDELCDRQLQIEELIENLEPLEKELIRYRYIDGMKWKDVFDKLGYSQKQTFRIHNKIIEKLEKMTHTGTTK